MERGVLLRQEDMAGTRVYFFLGLECVSTGTRARAYDLPTDANRFPSMLKQTEQHAGSSLTPVGALSSSQTLVDPLISRSGANPAGTGDPSA